MPFTDMLQSMPSAQYLPRLFQIVYILIEKSRLMIGIRSGADRITHDGSAVIAVKTKKLPAGLDVGPRDNLLKNSLEFTPVNGSGREGEALSCCHSPGFAARPRAAEPFLMSFHKPINLQTNAAVL